MNKLFFIVGVRRSGTSILRTLLQKHPKINSIDFEPHPLWFAVMMQHFDRFNDEDVWKRIVDDFKAKGKKDWHGAKFALNPGIDALDWIWLDKVFEKPRFIFIKRSLMDSYKSYWSVDKDIRRGAIDENSYFPAFAFVQSTFEKFVCENPDRSCIIRFEELVEAPDRELRKITRILGLPNLRDMEKFIKKPKNWSRE